MKKIVTEKEIIAALERQTFLIEQKLNREIIKVQDLNQNLPKGSMVSLSDVHTLLPRYIYEDFYDFISVNLNDLLQNPANYVQKYLNPGDFERAAYLVNTQILRGAKGQKVSFIQRFRPHISQPGTFTTNSLLKSKQELLGVHVSLKTIDVITNKMLRAIEETLYVRYNYHKFASLTPREKEIITLLALGYQNNEIGEQLFISKATVEQHRKNLKRKLEIRRFVDLIRFAQAFDLI
ncbi:response regulator transcription factor [Microscilla marina]|uniref:Transcriptional regulator, LuxR family protein n=1 Tax=Microscilla marina ATCC 23134 TaxID=313606 RepID=A1ZG54_MICM2|nr:helix-turn-helix transcriptional regulator [Microscilla marina]EAY30471.1 transcriptional regulator, LuxR family protein [Microscilla marina ATCC 23134]